MQNYYFLIKKLSFKNSEIAIQIAELNIASRQFIFENEEKEKITAEFIAVNRGLAFLNYIKKSAFSLDRFSNELTSFISKVGKKGEINS